MSGVGHRRYVTPLGPEAEFQHGSRGRVLVNLAGITQKRVMDRAEFDALVRVQDSYLDQISAETRFTADMICQMHKDWLGQLFAWAGKYRTVELAKSGFSWPPAMMVERNMIAFEKDVLAMKTPCRPGPMERVCLDMAEVHAGLLLIHPFREGNGRLPVGSLNSWPCRQDCRYHNIVLPDLAHGNITNST